MIKHASFVPDQFSILQSTNPNNGHELLPLPEEPQILRGELAQIWEYRGQEVGRQAVPRRQRCPILINGCCRDPSTSLAAIIVRSVHVERGVSTVESAS